MKKQIQAFKYRIYPTKDQAFVLRNWIDQMRFVWNVMLDKNKEKYKIDKKFLFRDDMNRLLPDLKKENIWI